MKKYLCHNCKREFDVLRYKIDVGHVCSHCESPSVYFTHNLPDGVYRCLDCGWEFREPDIVTIEPKDFDFEGEPFDEAWCPACGSTCMVKQETLDGCIIKPMCLGEKWVEPEYKRRTHD